MATHSSILSWRIPWTKEPGGLQSMGSQRVRLDWATNTHRHRIKWRLSWRLSGRKSGCNAGDSGSIPTLGRSPGGGHGNPLQHSCLETPLDSGAWRALTHEAAQSWRTEPVRMIKWSIFISVSSGIAVSFKMDFSPPSKEWIVVKEKWKWTLLSCVRLFATPGTSMEFSRPGYWSG